MNDIAWWPEYGTSNKSKPLMMEGLYPKEPAALRLGGVTAKRGGLRLEHDGADVYLRFHDDGVGSSEVAGTVQVAPGMAAASGPSVLAGISGQKEKPAVAARTPAPATAPAVKVEAAPTRIEVSVECAHPAKDASSTPEPVGPAPDADQDPIERPAYQAAPRKLVKSVTSVTSMVVRIGEDGDATGATSDIIAVVAPESRRSNKAGAGFSRVDGDDMMRVAFEEAVRAVTLRYPIWEPGHVDFSFGEKFVGHGGPSAGTAFALLLLSELEGFEIDRKCAVTGDITVDWKVRKVGGVTAKLRGATLDKCLYAAIPEDNATAFADMALLYDTSALWDIQVLSIDTLQDAVAVARRDRPEKLAKALALFAELQTKLRASGKPALASPGSKAALKEILTLAPNHLSAKYLLDIAEGKASKTLSANATLYRLSTAFFPFRKALYSGKKIDRNELPAYEAIIARKRLNALRPIADKNLLPLISDVLALIEAMDNFAANGSSGANLISRAESFDARVATMSSDRDFAEKIAREGY